MALNDNILAYWKLDNDGSGGVSLLDSTGNSYDLSDSGGNVGLGAAKLGTGSAYCDGTNSLITNSIPDVGSGDFAVAGWFNSNVAITPYPVPFGTSNAALAIYATVRGDTTSEYRVQVGGDLEGGLGITTGATLNSSEWYHAVVTRSSGIVSIYLNGYLVGTGLSSGSPELNNFYIGSTTYGSETNFNGLVDEVGIWNRALSSNEITNLYNFGSGIQYPFPFLYYNNAEDDGDLDNLLNWWSDSIFTIQASALPTSASTAYLYANASSGDLSCFSATLQNSIISGAATITGIVTLNGTSGNAATINGNAIFNANSYQDASGVVNGNAQFFNTTGNIGTITGNATFRDSSGNSYDGSFGTVDGNATVYNPSTNPIVGTVLGTVTYEWPNGTGLWGNEVWIDGSASFIIPSESDVRAGVEYGPANSPYTGTYTGGGSGGNNGIDLARLLGLPPFIKL